MIVSLCVFSFLGWKMGDVLLLLIIAIGKDGEGVRGSDWTDEEKLCLDPSGGFFGYWPSGRGLFVIFVSLFKGFGDECGSVAWCWAVDIVVGDLRWTKPAEENSKKLASIDFHSRLQAVTAGYLIPNV